MCSPAATQAHSPGFRPVERWKPALNADTLALLASLLRELKPLDAILDDVGDVLGDQDPPPHEFEETAEQLRGDLKRLVDIAVVAEDKDAEVVGLVTRARALRSEELPGGYATALGHLRRMAGTTNALLERLAATGSMREIA
ncbi:DUF6415 family natural product biosynthesis protein [Streptomyces sp. NPDC093109]|uniref:DUF6415 family natural product biosynthesis protein n=1 Tax=Streptomyces sp. NPDC093109 TaxID=3154977 RepID=UPI00344B5620